MLTGLPRQGVGVGRFLRGLIAVALLAGFHLMVLGLIYAALVLAVLVTGQAAFQPMALPALVGLGVVVLVVVRSLARSAS